MKRVLLCLSLSLCLWGMGPRSSEAQLVPGVGGELPVHDAKNLIENALTALRMLEQLGISNHQLDTMIINLLQSLELAQYPLQELEGLLYAISQSSGPRPTSALRLDYFNSSLLPTTKERFPGYAPLEEPIYPDLYAWNADTTLNTTESILGQTNIIAGIDSDLRYDEVRDKLIISNRLSEGNLQAQQVGNITSMFAADGIRRTEKSLAGLVSLTSARNAHDMQKEAWGEVMTRTSLDLAYVEEPPLYNGGAGGIKYVGTYSGGQQGGGF